MIFVLNQPGSAWISPKLPYEPPGGNLVDGLPPAAHFDPTPPPNFISTIITPINLLYESLMSWNPWCVHGQTKLPCACQNLLWTRGCPHGAKNRYFYKNTNITIMLENLKILRPGNLCHRDVESHKAFRKPSLAYELGPTRTSYNDLMLGA